MIVAHLLLRRPTAVDSITVAHHIEVMLNAFVLDEPLGDQFFGSESSKKSRDIHLLCVPISYNKYALREEERQTDSVQR